MDILRWHHIALGDRQAFADVYKFYYKRLFNYGRKFTEDGDIVEGTIHETFINIWENRKKFTTIESPQGYLFYMFRNLLFFRLKREKKRGEKEESYEPEPQFNAENIIIRQETDIAKNAQIKKVIEQLPTRQREAIFLRFYEGRTYEQIAEIMHITVPSCHKVIYKALNYFRKTMSSKNY